MVIINKKENAVRTNKTSKTVKVAAVVLVTFSFGGCTRSFAPEVVIEDSIGKPHYDYAPSTLDGMVREATLIARGKVIHTEPTEIRLMRMRYDNPEDDPYSGTPDAVVAEIFASVPSFPARLAVIQLSQVISGKPQVGESVRIIQPDDTSTDFPFLQVDGDYLLFAGDRIDGAFYVVGAYSGIYEARSATTFTAAVSEPGRPDELEIDQVNSLVKYWSLQDKS